MTNDSMADDKLKRAWRAATADSAPDALPMPEADALAALVQGGSGTELRDATLAAVGESARNSDLLATLRALSADAEALSLAVAEQRQPAPVVPRARTASRRWLALAAGVAALAVTVSSIQQSAPDALQAPSTDSSTSSVSALATPAQDTQIMAASFDEAGTADAAKEIFLGDFDS